MPRCLALLTSFLLTASGGCCCFPCLNHGACGNCASCGPYSAPGGCYGDGACCNPCGCGLPTLWQLAHPITWNGTCNECDGPGGTCATCCGSCGIFSALCWNKSCGQGCGEIYWDEWCSDPPDCCDPCDKCSGCWTGHPCGCNLGPCERLLAAFHGYTYCPAPNCGPVCTHTCCEPSCPCTSCGGAGCAGFGCSASVAPPHGAVLHGEGPHLAPAAPVPTPAEAHSILDENWDAPKAQPEPGKPIHKAQQQPRGQMTRVPAYQRTAWGRVTPASATSKPIPQPNGQQAQKTRAPMW